jgi:hypothetical protein
MILFRFVSMKCNRKDTAYFVRRTRSMQFSQQPLCNWLHHCLDAALQLAPVPSPYTRLTLTLRQGAPQLNCLEAARQSVPSPFTRLTLTLRQGAPQPNCLEAARQSVPSPFTRLTLTSRQGTPQLNCLEAARQSVPSPYTRLTLTLRQGAPQLRRSVAAGSVTSIPPAGGGNT